MTFKWLSILLFLSLAGAGPSAKCKYEVNEADHLESRVLILYRGGITGMAGHFGIDQGQAYLLGRYASNFKGRASFTLETPLELTLADGSAIALAVMEEAISSKIRLGHVLTVAREARPIFAVTPVQWQALRSSPITEMSMSFYVGGELHEVTRPVKPKHAAKIQEALECVQPGASPGSAG